MCIRNSLRAPLPPPVITEQDTGNSTPQLNRGTVTPPRPSVQEPTHHNINVYTDGSFKASNPDYGTPATAGWGAVFQHIGDSLQDQFSPMTRLYGPVVTNTRSQYYLGAKVKTNNTAELSAVAEAFLYVQHNPLPCRQITVLYDSKYAANMIRGTWTPRHNRALINTCQELYQQIRQIYQISWKWIRGHTHHPGNDEADRLANIGRVHNPTPNTSRPSMHRRQQTRRT